MLTAVPPASDCQVELDIAAGRYTWSVTRPDGMQLSGQAEDPTFARNQSHLAAVMLDAFASLKRRRF
ncbi:hypothetical protein DDF62_09485 [Caulobacter radicis]|uniref:hypothetical protein n=1 Tax=Caulobacter radicis TaxID=2172650 RepID=UPI000D56AC51|nr:hypothetical protein [Caulobacter radicis]PVM90471.1 hypothetical protein DDF62_09485 [Caulobacter radicis]